ncbi:hypothetical protein Taro_028609 [Colocasia esculenta]|uniref:Aminotransferase-like plant mobile domain-containing protein n=1 Tax=Colocasia esculenta TaxID=4460 RepID=A0A843VQV8_COLES|nr:hypothetical protein [Colocasia esculenta]
MGLRGGRRGPLETLEEFYARVRGLLDLGGRSEERCVRIFVSYFFGHLLFAMQSSQMNYKFVLLLRDLAQEGRYAWGAAILGHLFSLLPSSSWRSQSTGGFTPFLQIYTRFPMGRGTLAEGCQTMVPLMGRWEVAPDPKVIDRRIGDVPVALDHYPHEQVVWTPYAGEADASHPAVAAGQPLFDRHILLLCLGTCEVLYLELVVRTLGWHQPAIEVPSLGREGHSRRWFFAVDRDWGTDHDSTVTYWREGGEQVVRQTTLLDSSAYMEDYRAWYAGRLRLDRRVMPESQAVRLLEGGLAEQEVELTRLRTEVRTLRAEQQRVSVVWLVAIALPSRTALGLFSQNDALVVLVEVLPEPVFVASTRVKDGLKQQRMASSSTGKSMSMNPGILSEVPGHLSTRLAKREEVPAFPSQGQARAFSWLVNLVNAITLDMRGFIGMWNLSFMVVLAKNMKEMWWGFDALGALVERWHPHTQTFVFQGFEANVLLEEVEWFLGWRRCVEYDVTTPLLPWEEILANIVQDKKEVLRMMNKHGIFLDRLAWWLIQHAKEIGGERATRGMTLCLAGVFLFPTSGYFLLYEHVGILSLLWHGQSLAPAVLAHLYNSLTAMSLGGCTCGSLFLLHVWMEAHLKFDFAEKQPTPSRIFLRSSVHCSRAWYEPEDDIKCVTAHLKSRDAWRDYLGYFLVEDFIVRLLFMRAIEFRIRSREDMNLWLIGADRMVVYQPHRCHCQLGIPRVIPTSSSCTDMIIPGRNEKLMKKARKTWERHTVSKKVGQAVQEIWEDI